MHKASEAFTEPASATSGRTHRHSLDLPEPPTCGRSSPDMRPTAWSSHGSIRFRRDTVDDPAWRREQVMIVCGSPISSLRHRLTFATDKKIRAVPSPEAGTTAPPRALGCS
jgi:hypothetical protein